MDLPLTLAPEVAAAQAAGRPVVALESTIITHGMPWPDNLAMARRVEDAVRAGGAVPATIAAMDGRLRIGLDPTALESLARTDPATVMKLSRADLAVCLAQRRTGATTVAATMIAAHLAGIGVFATGGIGGVHRGDALDVSADLHELARTPVTVVCAGAKAILDLPRTFELLETLGVPVIAVGQDAIPAFWSRDSGLLAPLRIDDPAAIASAAAMRRRLGLAGGQLVVNPIPAADEVPAAIIGPAIDAAVAEAEAQAIAAKAVTPFLLARIVALTEGRSLAANIALVLNNARLAARIAAVG